MEYIPASCVRLPEGNNGQNYVTMGIYCDGWNGMMIALTKKDLMEILVHWEFQDFYMGVSLVFP